jgi:hypothetical protein
VVRTTGKNFFVAKLEDVPPCTAILASARTKSGTLSRHGVNLAMVNIHNEGHRQHPNFAMSHQAKLSKYTFTEYRSENLSSMVKLTADLRVTTSMK